MMTMPPLKENYIEERSSLPVYQHRSELCTLVAENDVVLVVAETVSRAVIIIIKIRWIGRDFISN